MPGKETARQHRALAQDQYKRGQYMEAMRSADKVRHSSELSGTTTYELGVGPGIPRY
jgi:hypothetical protein